jgi:hemerythrin-like domain-containing protein
MDATALLKKQHRVVSALFKQVEKADDARTRRRLMHEIVEQLRVHTTIEEEIFYPAVKEIGSQKAGEMTDEALEEHHVVKLVLKELPEVDPADERFAAKMTVLKELIEHHVEEEQDEMFPLAEKKLGDDILRQLGERLQERAQELHGQDSTDARA